MKLTIYHTNDIHSRFEAFSRCIHTIKRQASLNDLIADCGDFADMRSPLVSATQGKVCCDLLKDVYDIFCIGNNEIDNGYDTIQYYGESEKCVCINLTSDQGRNSIPHLSASKILIKKGIRLLCIGAAPISSRKDEEEANVFFHMSNLHSHHPYQLIQDEIKKYQGEYDLCVVLSHRGVTEDQLLAEKISGIDLIIGGHTHTYLHEAMQINNTWILQAGQYGEFVGKAELEIEGNKIVSCHAQLLEVDEESDPETDRKIKEHEELAKKIMSETIAIVPKLEYIPEKECDLMNFICDALRKDYPCDLALMHHGIVSGSLEGNVSKLTLLKLSESKLNPTRVKLSGKAIKEALLLSFDEERCLSPAKGAGFRGTLIGALAVSSNVKVQKLPFHIWINDEEIQDEKIYDVIEDDYLQRSDGYPSLGYLGKDIIYYNGFIRDVIERHLEDEEIYQSCKIRRIKY